MYLYTQNKKAVKNIIYYYTSNQINNLGNLLFFQFLHIFAFNIKRINIVHFYLMHNAVVQQYIYFNNAVMITP